MLRYAQWFVSRRLVLSEGVGTSSRRGCSSRRRWADHGNETYGYRLSARIHRRPRHRHVLDGRAAARVRWRRPPLGDDRERGRDRRYPHLGADDAEVLVAEIRPRLAVLTHLGDAASHVAGRRRSRSILCADRDPDGGGPRRVAARSRRAGGRRGPEAQPGARGR